MSHCKDNNSFVEKGLETVLERQTHCICGVMFIGFERHVQIESCERLAKTDILMLCEFVRS